MSLLFALGYFSTDQLEAVIADVYRVERWLALGGLLVLAAALGVLGWRWNHLGKRP